MKQATVTIVNRAGLQARAASRLAALCAGFDSAVKIGGERLVDGKSILSLMMLAAAKGSELQVIVDGNDENEAMAAIEALIADGFGED